jgi:hypothetical protein
MWQTAGMSKDGSKLITAEAYTQSTGQPYYFDGSSWAAETPAVGYNKRTVADISGKGEVLIAAGYGGRLYIKKNGIWTEHQPAGDVDKNWMGVCTNRG